MRPTHYRALFRIFGAMMTFALARVGYAECQQPGDPDCVRLHRDYRGTMDFFATGASFAINNDADDRPDDVLETAEVTVPDRRIPPRATLVEAFLYFGGSLYDDPDPTDVPDETVEIQVPGSDGFISVTGEQVYRSGAILGFPEVTLYSVRADITQIMQNAGGKMTGTYRVRDFAADILSGELEHTAANASFSIVLVFEEPRLPPRNIVLFDGLQEVLGSSVSLSLEGFIVSEQPAGSLTFYAQEGDCHPGPDDCAQGDNRAGIEQIRVIGAEPDRRLVLQDDINPQNDIFNRTINTVDPPSTNVTGTDIDTFDISSVLRPGDQQVTVEVITPFPNDGNAGELVGLAYVIVGIDVFAPELRVDSRIEIRNADGEARDAYAAGEALRLTYALSNTGNLPGTQVRLTTELPPEITDFMVLRTPEGTTVNVDERQIEVTGATIRHGEADALVILAETNCPVEKNQTLALAANVSAPAEGGVPFTMTTTVAIAAREQCGPRYFLYGGGGCRSTAPTPEEGPPTAWWMLILGAGLFRRRLRLWALLLSGLLILGCGDAEPAPDRPPPEPIGTPCPDQENMVRIPQVRGTDAFCMDRYEATIEGTTARSDRFAQPVFGVTWEQARSACVSAGKRLCTAVEWQIACRGPEELTYPYGDDYEPLTCNGFDAARRAPVQTGAMIQTQLAADGRALAQGCVSAYGVYDLSGNVWEWNDTEFLGGTRRGLAGGSYRSNLAGLTCATADRHAPPSENADSYGFRCCSD